MKKNLIVLVVLLVVLSMVLSACSSSPSTSASLSSTDITVGDVVEINQMFPPIINWEEIWKDSLNGEAGRAPSQAEMFQLVASLEEQGVVFSTSTEQEKAFEILQNGGVLVLTVMSPIPGDEIVVIGSYIVQGVKFFIVAATSVAAIRTVGNLTIPQLKEKTRHTLWTHDVLSMDAQTYIRTLTGSPKDDKNLMCAIVRMTSGAIRYVMAQKVVPHLNQAIFAWYSEAAWGGAYLIDTKEFPASSADVASFSSILCDQLPPPPPLPQ